MKKFACNEQKTCLTADPGVASSIPAQSHTLIDLKIISMVTSLPLIQEGLLSVTSESLCTVNSLVKLAQEKSAVR